MARIVRTHRELDVLGEVIVPLGIPAVRGRRLARPLDHLHHAATIAVVFGAHDRHDLVDIVQLVVVEVRTW